MDGGRAATSFSGRGSVVLFEWLFLERLLLHDAAVVDRLLLTARGDGQGRRRDGDRRSGRTPPVASAGQGGTGHDSPWGMPADAGSDQISRAPAPVPDRHPAVRRTV